MIKLKKTTLAVIVFLMLLTVYFIWENNTYEVSNFTYVNENVPSEFNGYKIVQISDLHSKKYGTMQKNLINSIKNIMPDAIFITGDIMNYNDENTDNAENLITGIRDIAPVFFVSGNNEKGTVDYENTIKKINGLGATVLENKYVDIKRGNQSVRVIGISDIESYKYCDRNRMDTFNMIETLKDDSKFQILLAHRPEMFDIYSTCGMDVVFSGHVHGGEIRIPYVCGILSPNSKLFPKYTSGVYSLLNSKMYVSRGLGDKNGRIRIFDRPQLLCVTFQTK